MPRALRAPTPVYIHAIGIAASVLLLLFGAFDGVVLAAAIRVWITVLAPRYAAVAGIWSAATLLILAIVCAGRWACRDQHH